MLKLGTQNISSLYVGGEKIKRALVGEDVVFEDTPTYTITFYGVDEDAPDTALQSSSWVLAPGESKTLTPWMISGYTFVGWYDKSGNLLSTASSFTVTATENATYYLKYYAYWTLSIAASFKSSTMIVTVNGEDYSITRNADGQGNAPELHLRKNSTVTVKIKALPDGYKFDNWLRVLANVTSTADPYTFTLDRDYEILHGDLSVASRLPEGYTELEWIETTAKTSYITLYSTAAAINCVDMDVMILGSGTLSGSGNRYFFDSGDSSNFIGFYHYTTGTTADNGRYSNNSIGSSYTITGSTVPKDKKFNVKWDPLNKKVSFNGVSAAMNGTKASTMKLYVGSANYSGCECLRYYEVRVTVGSTVITFVPCKRNSDNKLGLFILGNTTNSGYKPVYSTANWTAGPAV